MRRGARLPGRRKKPRTGAAMSMRALPPGRSRTPETVSMAGIGTAAAADWITQLWSELCDHLAIPLGIENQQLEIRPVRLVDVLIGPVRVFPRLFGQDGDISWRQIGNPFGRRYAPGVM